MTTSPTPPHRFRFGLRTLFVLVTVVAVGISSWQLMLRRQDFLSQAKKHGEDGHLDVGFTLETAPTEKRSPFWDRFAAFQEYHRRMCDKYERAARYPWLPVAPDPPAPAMPSVD